MNEVCYVTYPTILEIRPRRSHFCVFLAHSCGVNKNEEVFSFNVIFVSQFYKLGTNITFSLSPRQSNASNILVLLYLTSHFFFSLFFYFCFFWYSNHNSSFKVIKTKKNLQEKKKQTWNKRRKKRKFYISLKLKRSSNKRANEKSKRIYIGNTWCLL